MKMGLSILSMANRILPRYLSIVLDIFTFYLLFFLPIASLCPLQQEKVPFLLGSHVTP